MTHPAATSSEAGQSSKAAYDGGGDGAGPVHVAIIMDGNGRWAKARGLTRTEGHKEGVEAARRAVEAARDLGLSYLTLYSFSTENWRLCWKQTGVVLSPARSVSRAQDGTRR